MANPLDEVTDPCNSQGREARVIEKQLPVTIGAESVIFEIAICLIGFVPGAVVSFAVKPDWPPVGVAALWCAGILAPLIYWIMKIQAKNYFMQLLQQIQASASTIGNYQEQRYQELKNIAALVNKAIKLDTDVMTAVAAYRGGSTPDGEKLNSNAEALNRGYAALVPHLEAYPDLKAHASIADAMRQNKRSQAEITAAREVYNQVVLVWNTEIYNWPVKQIVAARSHFTTKIPFTVSQESIEGSKGTFF